MSFESFIALRYLKTKKAYRFLSLLSLISLLGIFISVFSFVVIHSVMNGFSDHLRKALIGFDAHLTVSSAKENDQNQKILSWLQKQRGVLSATPVIEFDAIIKTPYGIAGGAKVRGINKEDLEEDSSLKIYSFQEDELDSFSAPEGEAPLIFIGEELFTRLRFFPGDDELVSLIYPFGDVGPSGEIEPKRREFQIGGILSTGFYDYDTRYVFVDREEAGWLTGEGEGLTKILVRLKPRAKLEVLKQELSQAFPEIQIATWAEQNKRLFSALKLERFGMLLLLSIVTFIACFNVFGLMTLLVLNKSRETAIFYALGSSRNQIRTIFTRLGVFLGVLGTLLGLAGGLLVSYLLQKFPLPLPPAYYLEILPISFDFRMLLLIFFMAPFFAVFASLGPAFQASRLDPMEILRST